MHLIIERYFILYMELYDNIWWEKRSGHNSAFQVIYKQNSISLSILTILYVGFGFLFKKSFSIRRPKFRRQSKPIISTLL